MEIAGEKRLEDEILKVAEGIGTAVEIISTDTPKGEQLKELGGIAGILRYRAG
jgi:stalled ribosome rescue protein Dom34